MKYATKKCGVPQPTTAAPQERSPADAEDDDELDQSVSWSDLTPQTKSTTVSVDVYTYVCQMIT